MHEVINLKKQQNKLTSETKLQNHSKIRSRTMKRFTQVLFYTGNRGTETTTTIS